MTPRLLFILKARETYWGEHSTSGVQTHFSSGLYNSARFVVDMLQRHGVEAKLVEVKDNNAIDQEVSEYRPTHAIVEAYWVVPSKFDELKPLHPRVRWIVRNHSEMAFLANEGIALDWSMEYLKRGVEVMCNSPRATADLRAMAAACGLTEALVTFGPNTYGENYEAAENRQQRLIEKRHLDIGCFGAIRPLKNQLPQAMAAIELAEAVGLPLHFHINSSRVEGSGESILKNLERLFHHTPHHSLHQHHWLPHELFLQLMRNQDILLQVSFSETFNIVAADAVNCGVPVVVSPEVPWAGKYSMADSLHVSDIAKKLVEIYREDTATANWRMHEQRRDLHRYCASSEAIWLQRFPRNDTHNPRPQPRPWWTV